MSEENVDPRKRSEIKVVDGRTVEEYARRMNFARERSALAWTFPETENKEMDTDLVEAFARILVQDMYAPNLGCATTRDLLKEVVARLEDTHPKIAVEIRSFAVMLGKKVLDYKPVSGEGP